MPSILHSYTSHAIAPLFGIATLLVGLAGAALFSLPISGSRHPKSSLSEVSPVQTPDVRELLYPAESKQIKKQNRPKATQSAIIHFPHHGAVRVESVEQIGEFPKIVFSDHKSHALLFESSTKDPDGFLRPSADTDFTQPFLRFREVHSPGFPSPLVMAVAVQPGGSDNGFYLTIFGEINGKIIRLTDRSIDTAIQGGYYLGFLNRKFGFGLVSWCFVWDFNKNSPHEAHYDPHYYEMTVYSLRNEKFRKVLSTISKRKYDPEHSSRPLRELQIKAIDERRAMPGLSQFVED